MVGPDAPLPGEHARAPLPGEHERRFERTLQFDGCVNFRDLGGYRTSDGHQTRWATLYRADGLHRLSGADCDRLVELRVATVIDLRTVDEAEQRGRFPVDDVPVRYVDLPLTDVLPTPEEMSSWAEASYVAARYVDMVTRGAPALAGAFEALAATGSLPAVFHCSAGKDRTGVLAALVLAFLGVPDETIVADYVLSAAAMERLLGRLADEYPDSVEEVLRYAPAVLQVSPETMEQFLAGVTAEYGSYGRLAESLGVVPSVEELRRTVLEPA